MPKAVMNTRPIRVEGLDVLELAGHQAVLRVLLLNRMASRAVDSVRDSGAAPSDCVALYRRIYDVAELLNEALEDLTAIKDHIKFSMLPRSYEAHGTQTNTTVEGDRAHITQKVRATIAAKDRSQAYQWLRDHGHEALIIETVNAASLSAFVSAELEEARDVPEDSGIRYALIEQASLTRKEKPTLPELPASVADAAWDRRARIETTEEE